MRSDAIQRLLVAGALCVAVPAAVSAGGGTVTGEVRFEGAAPAPKPVNFGAEKQCSLLHPGHAPVYEDLVVNADGTLKYVLVHVTDAVPGDFPVPTEPVIVEQNGCVFSPHVAAVRVGQPAEFRNNDPVLHNVRSQSKKKQSFNLAQPTQGMKTARTFKEQEIGIPIKCDVHFWMLGYLHALAHPFFAVTGDDGRFSIPNLPAGTYTLEAWHETLGVQTLQVTVAEGQEQAATFTFHRP